ncbi:meiosis inhibitor protein 1-like, partial [Hypomesus transpacificus]|uniref:meiosis inhibitor protein 1-like n=1 Tax=Hypomesus transpacificus TaxID=137520 RepID=UPI001F073207
RLCSALLYPDEGLKTSLFYVWQRVCGAAGGSGGAPFGALSLPGPLRERLCMQLLQTLEQACCPQLTINCLGLLLQLLKLGEVVSFLMNSSSDPGQGQDQDPQTTTPQLSLPLILKKVLAAEELILTRGCHEITC